MDKILPIVLTVIFVGAGVFGGLTLRPTPEPMFAEAEGAEGEEGYGADAKDGEKKDKKKDKKKDDKSGDKKSKDKKKKDGDKKKDKKKKDDKKDKKKDKDKKGDGEEGDGYGEESTEEYLKFGRQFLVPVLESDDRSYIIMMDINVVAASGALQAMYPLEPRLRDALLGALFTLSNEGALGERFLVEENMSAIRERLLSAAQEVVGESAEDILILSIARQRM